MHLWPPLALHRTLATGSRFDARSRPVRPKAARLRPAPAAERLWMPWIPWHSKGPPDAKPRTPHQNPGNPRYCEGIHLD
ncbi:MAG: hypothetical protein EpisKO_04750 [Epibacterium sp.]